MTVYLGNYCGGDKLHADVQVHTCAYACATTKGALPALYPWTYLPRWYEQSWKEGLGAPGLLGRGCYREGTGRQETGHYYGMALSTLLLRDRVGIDASTGLGRTPPVPLCYLLFRAKLPIQHRTF